MAKLLTTQEAADILGLTTGRVRQLMISRELPAERFGEHSWTITPAALADFIRRRKRARKAKTTPIESVSL